MNETAGVTDPIGEVFANQLRRRLGDRVRDIRLFGSRARGDASPGSDYDMLVVVDQRSSEIRNQILEVEVDLLDRYDVLVASVVRSEAEWLASQSFPLARNIAREGIRL